MGNKVGIGILSWRAHDTLIASLESYKAAGFLDLFAENLIYFSDISDEDKEIAARFGWSHAGGENRGIAGGMKALAENMQSDYVLLLQNDNPLIESPAFANAHLDEAIALLDSGKADLARLRHRWQVGEGFSDVAKYLRYFPARNVSENFIPKEHGVDEADYKDSLIKRLRRTFRPLKARRISGRSVFLEEAPEKVTPRHIRKDGNFYLIDSAAINFSDQCLLISKDKWLNLFMDYVEKNPSSRRPNGFQAPEICINGPWWQKQGFISAQGQGLFTHRRWDGSFRKEHPAYQV